MEDQAREKQMPTREQQMANQRGILAECAQTTRRACEEMIRLIDAGEFASGRANDQFDWLRTLKSRRQLIVGTILTLDGQREDRTGQSVRERADKENGIGMYRHEL